MPEVQQPVDLQRGALQASAERLSLRFDFPL